MGILEVDKLLGQEPDPLAAAAVNLTQAAGQNPQEHIERRKLSNASGVPAALMDDPEVRERARRDAFARELYLKEHPATAGFAANPNNAPLITDDIVNLKDFEDKTRTLAGTAGDIGLTALKGVIAMPQAFVGLADIPTGGRIGKALEYLGYKPGEAQDILGELYSPAQKEVNLKVESAEGVVDTAVAAVQNPSVIGQTILESLPSMLGGAGLARGGMAGAAKLAPKLATKLSPMLAAALGEGAISAGGAAEQIRGENEDGLLTLGQAAAALASGGTTAAFSILGGKVAEKLGIADVDVLLTGKGASAGTKKALGRRVLEGMATEGILEEMPQSATEQMWQNTATGKPLFQGVDQAIVLGAFAGMAMGGGSNIVTRTAKAEQENTALLDTLTAAEASRLKAGLPESFAEFAQRAGDQHGLSALYLQADKAVEVALGQGLTVEQIMPWLEQYGATAEALDTAIQTGGTIALDYGKVAAGFSNDPTLQALKDDFMVSPSSVSKATAAEAEQVEEAHLEKLNDLFAKEQDLKIGQEDVQAWTEALLATPGLDGRVTAESLSLLSARANALTALTGKPAIEHLNKMLGQTGLTTMKLKDFRELYGSAGEEIGQPQELGQGGRTVIYHGTTEEAAAQIEEAGFDVSKSADGSIWFTSNPQIGEVAASGKGAVVKRAFDESNLKLAGWEESDKYSTDELIAMGYDGLRLEDGDETTYQIFHPDKLEKVSEALAQSDRPFDGPDVAKTPLPEGTTTVEVDGVERPALNSEDRPIHPTVEGVKNFWRWFGDSKVVDSEGRPLVMYHGSPTPEGITEFSPGGKPGSRLSGDAYGVASYFTSYPGEASVYARYEGAVFPVYVRGEILDVDSKLSEVQSDRVSQLANEVMLPSDKARFAIGREVRSFDDVRDARDFFDAQRKNWEAFGDGMDRARPEARADGGKYQVEFTNFDAEMRIETGEDALTLFKAIGFDNIVAAGFDGLMLARDGGTKWVVMHRPETNVKSAIGNRGTFDPAAPSILMQQSASAAGATTAAEVAEAQRMWAEMGTESPYFKKWFGDSKVVDDQGRPLVVYHGGASGITAFDPAKIGERFGYDTQGFFFTLDNTDALGGAKDYAGDNGEVYSVYLSIPNPYTLDDYIKDIGDTKRNLMYYGGEQQPLISVFDDDREAIIDFANKSGKDGIVFEFTGEDGTKDGLYVAFSPTQIKSATGNRGTFDPYNPNILMQSDRPFDGPDIAKTPLPEGATTVEVDGVERPALNSEDRPIHPTVGGVKNFWRWFGDSKVVDDQGRPVVVYHGGQTDVADFSRGSNRGLSGLAYFTADQETASKYAIGGGIDADLSLDDYLSRGGDITGGRVTPVYLSLNNPLTDKISFDQILNLLGEEAVAQELANQSVSISDLLDEGANVGEVLESEDWSAWIPGEDALAFSKSPELGFLYGTGMLGDMLKRFDGMIYEDAETEQKTYVAFSPTQIKSATGNRGTFDPYNPNILMQSDRPFEAAKQRLSVLHSLSSDNLLFADKMGGLAVPSLAVVPEGAAMEGYGDITLIGTKELADPEKVPVFDADAYTATFPQPSYPKVAMKKAQKVVDYFKPFVEKYDSSRSILDTIWDNAVNRPDPARVLRDLADKNAAKAAFLASKGTDIGPVMRDKPLRYPWMRQPSWKTFADALEKRPNYNEELLLRAGEVVRQAVEEYLGTRAGADEKLNTLLREAELSQVLDEKGAMYFGPFDRAVSETRDLGKQELDSYATREKLDEALKGYESEFKSWLDDKILSMYGAPTLKVGGKKVPYTLDNIVKVMAAGRVQGKEQTLTFGEGQVRAAASKRFAGLEEMRGAAKDILPPKDIEAAREEAKKLGDEFRGAVLEYFTLEDWRGEVDTWKGLDSSMRAIARWAKTKRTAADLAAALRKEDFRDVPKDVLELGVEFGNALLTAPVPYFEAKPQRAVGLNEFAGAVVPSSAGEEVKAALGRNGVPYAVYDESDETARATAVDQLRTQLAQQGAMTLFQSAWHGSPHTFDKFSTSAIGTGEGAQAYGYGLYFAGSREVAEWYKEKLSENLHVSEEAWQEALTSARAELIAEHDAEIRTITAQLSDLKNAAPRVIVGEDAPSWEASVFSGAYSDPRISELEYRLLASEHLRSKLENDPPDENQFVLSRAQAKLPKGRLYKVELAPEEDEYLLWDKPLSEQSEKVKAALGDVKTGEISPDGFDMGGGSYILDNRAGQIKPESPAPWVLVNDAGSKFDLSQKDVDRMLQDRGRDSTGENVYSRLTSEKGSQKAASEYLHTLGIRGIKYLDGTSRADGKGNYNYVIFSDDDVAITEMFQAQTNDPLGVLAIMGDRNLVNLFEKADKSTFLHETAHIFLNDLKFVAETLGVQTTEWETAKAWLGIGEDGVITRAQHERFAEHFEVYLKNGQAPVPELRSAFRAFKRWLTAIYDNIKASRYGQRAGITISPEIANLFDHLLATDQEIRAAREQAALVALLDAEMLRDLDASPAQVAEYQNLSTQADDVAREKRDIHKLEDREELRKEWRKQAEAESFDQPVYGFIRAISKLGGINKQSVIDAFGAENLPDHSTLWRAKGDDINVAIAEHGAEFGYRAAADFVEQLRNLKPRSVWVEQRIAQLETLHDNAQDTQEVIRSTAMRRMLDIESVMLSKKTPGAQAIPAAAIKVWAAKTIAGRTIKQINMGLAPLQAQSRRLRQMAILAVRDGRWEDALRFNEQARRTEGLISASMRASKEWTKTKARWKRIAKWTNDNKNVKLGTAFRDQINRLLDQYEIASREYDDAAPDLQSFVALRAAGNPLESGGVALAKWLGVRIGSYGNLSWERLQDLDDALKFLYGNGREELEGQRTAEGEMVKEIAGAIASSMNSLKPKRELWSDATAAGRAARAVQQKYRKFMAHTGILRFICQRMDGYAKHGLAQQQNQEIINGMARENDLWASFSAKLEPIITRLTKDGGKVFTDLRRPAAFIDHGVNLQWTKKRVVCACLNMGNASNLQRLSDGFALSDTEIRALAGKLTAAEWQDIQAIWDTINEMWPMIADVHERINYFRPKKIEPQRLRIGTADGQSVSLPGGYYPVGYDIGSLGNYDLARVSERDDILNSHENTLQVPVAKSGMVKARADKVSRPLSLSFDVLGKHLHDSIRYIALAEAVRDTDRIFNNKELRAAAYDTIGSDLYGMIRPTLMQILRPNQTELGRYEWLRTKTSVFYMAWNTWTAVQNITGVFPAMFHAGVGNYVSGMAHVASEPYQAYKTMLEMSGYMRLRAGNMERDMQSPLKQLASGGLTWKEVEEKFADAGFLGIRAIDTLVSLPAWWGVYNDQMSQHGDVQSAIEAADTAINKALGSGLAIDQTGIGRSMWRLLAPFMSFASTQQEVLRTEKEALMQGKITAAEYLHACLMVWVFPAMASTFLSGLMMYGLIGAVGGGDDDDKRKKTTGDYFTDVISYRLMGLPFVRDAWNAYLQGAEHKQPITAARMPFTEFIKMGQQAFYRLGALDGDSEKSQKALAWTLAEMVSYASGLPVTRAYDRWRKGQEDIENREGWWMNHLVPQERKK